MAKVADRSELMHLLQGSAATLRELGAVRLGVFGSFARNTPTPDSDVDLFVELVPEKRTLKGMLGLSRFLEGLLGRKVEIVTPGSLNPFIGKYILEEVQYVALAA